MLRRAERMKLSYTEIFRYSDVLNPVSPTVLLLAGKPAKLGPGKTLLDLGSGKGFPSLFWAGVFGVRVEGFDINKEYVDYANSRAKMLNLSSRVRYSCLDIKELKVNRKYDVVACLGLGTAQIYGSLSNALGFFKKTLHKNGVLILAEPVWLTKPVSPKVLKSLGETEDGFPMRHEIEQLAEAWGFKMLGRFLSSKEDWESYVRPVYINMREIIETNAELAEEAQKVMNGFKAEYDAAGKYWNMFLCVARI